MAKKVIYDGSNVIVETEREVNGLFGREVVVDRQRYTREQWDEIQKRQSEVNMFGYAVAGVAAMIGMGLNAWAASKKKDDTWFKLPWK